MKRHSSEEYPQRTNELMKKVLTSSVIREMQNETTRYHFTGTSDFKA